MKIEIDTHTHSVASGHAYATVDELARAAREKGLSGFALTDHGPALPGGPHQFYFTNLRVIPAVLHGVRVYRGIEANILEDGTLDLPLPYLSRLEFVMAGFHDACLAPKGREENTRLLLNVLKNPLVDAISHPGNPVFPVDLEAAAKTAAECGKALEVNNSSFRVRPGSEQNCRDIVRIAAQYGALLSCGSDAHFYTDLGNFSQAQAVIEEGGIAGVQVINSSTRNFEAFLTKRRAVKDAFLKK